MIRFDPEPTPELRAARAAAYVAAFLEALGPSSSKTESQLRNRTQATPSQLTPIEQAALGPLVARLGE